MGGNLRWLGLAVLMVCSVSACDTSPTPETVETLGHFRGVVEDGVLVSFAMVPRDAAADDPGRTTATQALTPIAEDRDGRRGLAAVENVVELTTQGRSDLPADGFPAPGVVEDGCGPGTDAFEVYAGIRNFHSAPLTAVHVVIDRIAGDALDHRLCHSDPVPRNLLVDGQPVPAGLGLVRYGFLAADDNGPDALPPGGLVPLPRGSDTTARAVRWRFRHGGTFSFTGRIFGRVCEQDCTPMTAVNEGPLPGTPTPRFVDANGPILAVAEGNGVVYLGGRFSRVGHRTGAAAIVPANPNGPAVTGGHVPAFEGGIVDSAVGDGVGGFYVGGTFTSVGGFARARLVHILQDGRVDLAFNPPDTVVGGFGTISALAVDATDGRLWVGRTAPPHLSVLSSSTGATALSPADANNTVRDILVVDNSVFVAGAFEDYGGVGSRDKLVKLVRATGAPATGFANPNIASGNSLLHVNALTSDGTTLWYGGNFTSPRSRAAAIAVADGTPRTWNPGIINGEVMTLQRVPGFVYLGGTFTSVRGRLRSRLAVVLDRGDIEGMEQAWAPNPSDSVVHHLVVSGDTVYVGGNFTAINSVTTRVGAAAIAATPTIARPDVRAWNPSPSQPSGLNVEVRALALSGTRALLGGDFRLAGASPRARLASIDLASGALRPADANITDGEVRALAFAPHGTLYLGGTFTSIGGQTRNRIAAVNGSSFALITSFALSVTAGSTALDPTTTAEVDALAVSASKLYFGGNFGQVGTQVRGRLARASLDGTLDSWHDPAVGPRFMSGGRVRSIALLDGGDVLVGGDFTAPARRLARLGVTNGALVVDFNASSPVHTVAIGNRTAFVGGDFTTIDDQLRERLAAIDLATNELRPDFAPPGFDGVVQAIDLVGPSLVVGGAFTAPQNSLAVLDADTGADQGIATFSRATGTVRGVADVGPFIVVGTAAQVAEHTLTTAGPAAARRIGVAFVHAP